MAIKKYKYDTKTDTITTFPATIIGDGTPITSYTVKGNMEQNDTPTPSNPIYPSECGERTENLFDISKVDNGSTVTHSGDTITVLNAGLWYDLLCFTTGAGTSLDVTKGIFLAAGTYTIKIGQVVRASGTGGVNGIVVFSEDGTSIEQLVTTYSINNSEKTFTTATDGYISLRISAGNPTIQGVMLTAGFTAPTSYIPYGYKLPITLGSTTTDIYLGEVQSTRRIKKLVLTGEESWYANWRPVTGTYASMLLDNTRKINDALLCTHFEPESYERLYNGTSGISTVGSSAYLIAIRVPDTLASNDTEFKAYLAQQYAAGTPVTVWYVLAESETGIVNEPLRKIGDYVDSVSGTGLATSGTAQEFDIGTALKPSEVDIAYRTWISTFPCRKYTKSRNSNSAWVDVPSYTRTDGAWVRDSDTWCYGFKVLKTSDDPDLKVEYLEDAVGMTPGSMGSTSFDYGSWSNAPFMPRPCMLNFDGTVAYYLSMDDYSKKADGTPSDVSNFDFNGNAMAEYGLLWYKFSDGDENTEFEFRVSNKKLDDDFVCHCNTDSHNDIIDHFYVPIYNGTTAPTYDNTATYDVGAHVVYYGKEYRCITAVSTAEAFDNSKWDLVSNTPRMRSLSGVQLTPANGNGQTSGEEEIARAEACNVGADKEWFIDTLCDHELITMLHVLVAKSLDCQSKFGQGISSGSQTAKEAYVTGSLDDKGSFYGSTSATSIAVKTFCRENFWALVWRRMVGLVGSSGNFLYKLTPNTADGSTATSYNTNGSGYLNGGVRPAAGYVKNLKRSTDGFLPSVTTSSSVGTKDYYYNGNGYARVGGYSADGARDGPFCFHLAAAVSSRYWGVSGSPSCKPCKNKTET